MIDDMKKNILFLLLLVPSVLWAQKNATVLLDKAAARIKADAALQMDYGYTVYDDDDAVVVACSSCC